ncbi:MAG TPA: acetyl-CoA C-acyltransferase, partial [Blastocatellia bacterium]|nr:acetyl-CoA C-acyltransferase [Blastocatellia bacterium]
MKDAVIVKALRTAVGKAPRGALKDTRPDDMAGAVIRAAIESTPGL